MNDVSMWHYIVFVVCLAIAAFFCSAETAFVGIQKLRLQHLIRTGNKSASVAARIVEKPEKFLAAVLFGHVHMKFSRETPAGRPLVTSCLGYSRHWSEPDPEKALDAALRIIEI